MLSSKIHTLIFVCGTLVACSALKIGVLSNYLYLPSSSSNSYIPYFYSTNCTECLCYARRLSNYSFVLINCMSMGQMCFLYMNYSNNYSFQVNTIGTVYFFQLPNQAVTGTSSQGTTERTPTTGTTVVTTITDVSTARPETVLLTIYNPTSSNYPTYTLYTYMWTATSSRTTLSFTSRHDPGGWLLDDVAVNQSSTSLIVNGGFETGDLNGWSYSGSCTRYPGDVRQSKPSKSGNYYFYGTCVNDTDTISQQFSTMPGSSYRVSFWLTNYGCCSPVELFIVTIK